MAKQKWIILLVLFLATNNSSCQTDSLERRIAAVMKEYGAIGVSIAVVKDNNVEYVKSFGYKSREDSIPLRPDHLFRIASISKTFVATAIMHLVEKGKLSLDDDVNRYLDFIVQNPNYPETPITIKMLLSHRSSINDSQGYKNFDAINPRENPFFAKCYSNYTPGSKYTYSNLNYNLLGAVIENITGKRFDKYIQKTILNPLSIHGRFNVSELDSSLFVSSYWYNHNSDKFNYASDTYLPYTKEIKHYKLGYSTPFLSAAGGLKITALELARYMIMHMSKGSYQKKQIITPESERIMRKVPVDDHWYALSFSHYDNNVILGEELIGQTGGAHGIHTAMIFHPEKKYGFVVFCNGCKSKSSSMDGHELNFDVIRCLYKYIIK